jgi:hypothetical protein
VILRDLGGSGFRKMHHWPARCCLTRVAATEYAIVYYIYRVLSKRSFII